VSALSIDQVTYSYPGAARSALRDVSLEFGAGELAVVAGRSGCGKSTLLGLASGLVPHFHGGSLAGSVTVAGMDTREHGPGELAAAVGTLFQDPESQVVMGTVRAELAFPLENRGWSGGEVARGVEEAALALGIAHLLDRSTPDLSGGELQRVALAAALAGMPALIVLDEPTSQLDPVAGEELIGILRRLNEDTDATVILSEHRLERCLAAADRVVALDDGRVVCDAAPAEFLEWAVAEAPALATPGARLLRSFSLPISPGVKGARAALRAAGIDVVDRTGVCDVQDRPRRTALRFERVWHEFRGGRTVLRNVSLTLGEKERVALMGRNGAGKSTLVRHAAGLMKPTRGKIEALGRVALLLQNPNDYLVHDTVADEASESALERMGLTAHKHRHPRDLSGGEKQRLALAVVLDDAHDPPAVVCLDEPTRGMDRHHKEELAGLVKGLEAAVLVATHDAEFVAAFADRVLLLADGGLIADGATDEILMGGTYFATETARIAGVLTPEDALRRPEVLA
jgi:energy-coupling factor transport system ATP-binding protein